MADVQGTGEAAASDMWDDDKWHRYGLLAGVVFVVLQVAGVIASGTPPTRDATATEIFDYFTDNDTGIQVASVLIAVSFIVGLWWLGSLWRVIGRLEPSGPRLAFIAVAAFIVGSGFVGVSQGLFATMAIRQDIYWGEYAFALGYIMVSFGLAAFAAFGLALGALTLWTKFLPTWLGYVAFLAAVCCLGAALGAGTAKPFVTVFEYAAFGLLTVWVLVASIVMYRKNAGVRG